jgi:hypothetical protein
VLLQEDLLPLSRLPRPWTSAYSQPGFADFSRKMRTCGTAEQTKEVHNQTLKACVRPTATYRIETPAKEPFEVKYVIQPTLKTSAHSGMRTMDITQRYAGTPTKEIDTRPMHAYAQANYADPSHYVNNSEFDTSPYIQNTNPYAVRSNVSTNQHSTNIEDILDLSDLPIHNQLRTYSVNAPTNGHEQTRYIHEEIELGRNLPQYQATTNIGDMTMYKRPEYENQIELDRNIPNGSYSTNIVSRGFADHSSRDVRLAEKIQPGGYTVPGQMPMIDRNQNIPELYESEKARTNRFVMESMQHRFNNLAAY